MKCTSCGREFEGRFCPNCGTKSDQSDYRQCNVENINEQVLHQKNHSVKRKKILIGIVIVAAAIVVFLAVGVKIMDKDYISIVKEGCPESYPTISYGDAFEHYFSDPTWRYFISDDNRDIVEFTGGCMYRDTDVNVTIQFTVDYDDRSAEMSYLGINDVPQVDLIKYSIFEDIFDEYKTFNML